MITNLISPIAHKDETLKGISRSRFSFHFNTARKRHWLLVQLVTAPALPASDEPQQPTTRYTQQPERTDYNYLVDNFQVGRMTTRCI
jgi:hypothetical protein